MQLSTVYPEGPILRCSANLEWWSSLHCNVGTALQCSSGSIARYSILHWNTLMSTVQCPSWICAALKTLHLHCYPSYFTAIHCFELISTLHMKSFGHIRISISATSSICCASQLAMHQVHAVHHVNFTINHAFHRTASRIAVCKLDSCVWLLCSAERPNQVQSISCQHCTSSLHCRVQKQCKGCKIGGGIELAALVHVALNTNTNTWKSANSCQPHNQLQTQECQQISTITQTNIPEKLLSVVSSSFSCALMNFCLK